MALNGRAMVVLLVLLGLHSAAATEYTVGGSTGWTFASNSQYDDQFKSIKLFVGDVLLFPFQTGSHNVFEIPVSDVANCDYSSPIGTYNATNSKITLTSTGSHAYVCAFPTHCTSGMHLQVTVSAAAPTAPPPTVAPPTPAPVTPPTAAPVKATPAPAPVKATPAPAPVKKAPAPAPEKAIPAPAPSKKSPTKAPTEAPTPVPASGAPTSSSPGTTAPTPAPATSTSGSSSSVISSGSAIFMAAIVGGLAFVLV